VFTCLSSQIKYGMTLCILAGGLDHGHVEFREKIPGSWGYPGGG
jgi:hypothetical protein